jgi:hypothetical protein
MTSYYPFAVRPALFGLSMGIPILLLCVSTLLAGCGAEPSLLPNSPTTPPATTTTPPASTTTPPAIAFSLAGRLKQLIRTGSPVSQTITYTYEEKNAVTQGLLNSYTTVSGLPASATVSVVSLTRVSVLLTEVAEVIATAGQPRIGMQQLLVYEPGNDRNHVSQIIGTDASGQQYYHTYTYDGQGRLIRWQRDVVVGAPKLDLTVSLTWSGNNVGMVQETGTNGKTETTTYQWDNLPNPARQFLLDNGLPPGYAPPEQGQNNPISSRPGQRAAAQVRLHHQRPEPVDPTPDQPLPDQRLGRGADRDLPLLLSRPALHPFQSPS